MAVSGTKQAIMALSLDANRGGKVGLVCRLRETEDDKESGRRRREAESLAEVTDEENADLWLVEGKRKDTQSGSRRGGNGSRNGAFIKYRWQGVWAGVVVVAVVMREGGGVLNLGTQLL